MHGGKALSVGLLLFGIALSGCVSQPADMGGAGGLMVTPSISSLTAKGPDRVAESAESLLFEWQDTMPRGGGDSVGLILVSVAVPGGAPSITKSYEFQVGPGVSTIAVRLKVADPEAVLGLRVFDSVGGIACKDLTGAANPACVVHAPAGLTAPQWWRANVTTIDVQNEAGVAITITAELTAGLPFQPADLSAILDETLGFTTHKTGGTVGEPTLGVDSKGSIFVQAGLSTMKSSDRGKTWKDVAPATTSVRTLDPMLRVDPHNDRVWVSQLYLACSILAYSDDAGATWVTNPAGCGWPAGDHQKLAVGATELPASPYNGILYYAGHDTATDSAFVSRSLDGGLTFTPHFAGMSLKDDYNGLWTGTVEADRAGNVFISWAEAKVDGKMYVSVSNDYGLTYTMSVFGEGRDYWSYNDADFAFDDAGNTYFVWQGGTSLYYAMSGDHGKSWGKPVRVSPLEIASVAFPAAVGTVGGKLAVAYYGTADSPFYSDDTPGWTEWHLFTTVVEGADSAAPTLRHSQITPDSDPIQRGSICTVGTGCNPGTRNLLDFIDIVAGADGKFYVAYTDGCDPAHPDPTKVCDETGSTKLNDNWVAIEE